MTEEVEYHEATDNPCYDKCDKLVIFIVLIHPEVDVNNKCNVKNQDCKELPKEKLISISLPLVLNNCANARNIHDRNIIIGHIVYHLKEVEAVLSA